MYKDLAKERRTILWVAQLIPAFGIREIKEEVASSTTTLTSKLKRRERGS